jgi:hypothetical protein
VLPVGFSFASASWTPPGLGLPAEEQPRFVVEGHHEEGILRVEQVDQEPLDRRLGVLDAPAEHAVADVEQQAEAERHPLVRELRDRQALAVLVDSNASFGSPVTSLPSASRTVAVTTVISMLDRSGARCAAATDTASASSTATDGPFTDPVYG